MQVQRVCMPNGGGYCEFGLISTATVAILDVRPPIFMTIGIASPVGVASGIWILTTYNPARPGTNPANCTVAATSPMVTLGFTMLVASGSDGDGAPRRGRGET